MGSDRLRLWTGARDPASRWDPADLVTGITVALGDVPLALRSPLGPTDHLHDLLGALPPVDEPARSTLVVEVGRRDPGVWDSDNDLRIQVDGTTADVQHESGGYAGLVGPDAVIHVELDARPVAMRRLISVTLALAVGPHDRPLLHAGAVGVGRGAVLVLGESGAGKSTVVAAALAAGRPAWSDDLVLVRSGPARLELSGVPRPLAVAPEIVASLGLPSSPADEHRGRTVLSPSCFQAEWTPVLGAVVVAHGDRTSLELMAAADALPHLVGAHLAGWSPTLLGRWYPHAAELARGATWSLTHDPDPERRVAGLADALAQLDRSLG